MAVPAFRGHDVTNKFRIAIVGAGPAGLSAAARAAELGVSHVVLEASPYMANTVRCFQKGKLVMAEPVKLPLQSPLRFAAGTRESVLESWQREVDDRHVNLRTGAAVVALSGQQGDFRIMLATGDPVAAESVVLAIGVQGNIRKLGVPGEDLPRVQYQLDDPDEYCGETILVIGGGDAGIENALALAPRNRVILLNRQDEFANCREANYSRLKEAVAAGMIETRTSTSVVRVDAEAECDFPLSLVAKSPQGVEYVKCHRIVARLGAMPPRPMLERFGIGFPNDDPLASPLLSERYESNVPGLYVVGTLAGYPLIKQALNQGYEVVEYILGNPVEPADHAYLREKLTRIPGFSSVAKDIRRIQDSLPLFSGLSTLQLREFIFESEVRAPQQGEIIFRKNDYGNSFFSIIQGSVNIQIEGEQGKTRTIVLGSGAFFGEIGLLSGRRRTGTVIAGEGCVVVETPRRSMLKLLDSTPGVQRGMDEVALKRILHNFCEGLLSDAQVEHLVLGARLEKYAVGDTIFNEGDDADTLYMIRRGSVTVSRRVADREVILAYVAAGHYVDEMAPISKMPRTATVRAAAPTEMVVLDAERFNTVLDRNASLRWNVTSRHLERVRANETAAFGKSSEIVRFLVDQGIGEATDILLIDYFRCIRCDSCEKACADVHDGTSRLSRQAGRTYEQVHVPASCRHCEHPRCMKDCPSDAILRWKNGEVYIGESCIGCGNCRSNCHYGVIQMARKSDFRQPGLLGQIFGRRTPVSRPTGDAAESGKRAVKCDMCMGIIGGAACVRACPTGAAVRVTPEEFLAMSVR
jgi:CRP-like cAMP-binding protein/Fe-S-cluster-containing hydrogenase component 2/thioredoxin reductase